MSSTPTSLAATANVSSPASFAIVIYTIDETTTTTTVVSARGEDEVREEDKDEFNDAISKSILLGCF